MLDEIKKYYKASNLSLAALTGRSVDFIDSIREGRRFPSLKELNLFMFLYKALELDTPFENMLIPPIEKTTFNRAIDRKKRKLTKRIVLLQQNLTQLIVNRKVWLRGAYICKKLIMAEDTPLYQKEWLKLQKRKLEIHLNKNNAEQLQLLRATLVGLQAELDVLS